jgi:hypothetical protein
VNSKTKLRRFTIELFRIHYLQRSEIFIFPFYYEHCFSSLCDFSRLDKGTSLIFIDVNQIDAVRLACENERETVMGIAVSFEQTRTVTTRMVLLRSDWHHRSIAWFKHGISRVLFGVRKSLGSLVSEPDQEVINAYLHCRPNMLLGKVDHTIRHDFSPSGVNSD